LSAAIVGDAALVVYFFVYPIPVVGIVVPRSFGGMRRVPLKA